MIMSCPPTVRGRKTGPRDGFTLMEVLVALVVLGIAFAVIARLFAADLQGIKASGDYSAAAVEAMAGMRETLDKDKLTEGTFEEITDNGYRISVTVSKPMPERTENLSVELLEVDLRISWTTYGKTRTMNLSAMKLVEKKI